MCTRYTSLPAETRTRTADHYERCLLLVGHVQDECKWQRANDLTRQPVHLALGCQFRCSNDVFVHVQDELAGADAGGSDRGAAGEAAPDDRQAGAGRGSAEGAHPGGATGEGASGRDGAAHEDRGGGDDAHRADEEGAQDGAARATPTLALATICPKTKRRLQRSALVGCGVRAAVAGAQRRPRCCEPDRTALSAVIAAADGLLRREHAG